jgi:hypothetical protein
LKQAHFRRTLARYVRPEGLSTVGSAPVIASEIARGVRV